MTKRKIDLRTVKLFAEGMGTGVAYALKIIARHPLTIDGNTEIVAAELDKLAEKFSKAELSLNAAAVSGISFGLRETEANIPSE